MKRFETAESRKKLARTLAAESFVLLENKNQCLPLKKGKVAFFGRAYKRPVLGGMGSGMSFRGKETPSVGNACEAAGLVPVRCLEEFYEEALKREKVYDPMKELALAGPDWAASGAVYEIFGKYRAHPAEPAVPEGLVRQAARETDTAVWVFGRGAGGEECDRRLKDDFYLQESEKQLLEQICNAFPKVVVLLDSIGAVDVSWIPDYGNIQAVLFIGAAGEEGPAAAAQVLSGSVSPSGKLAFTLAGDYEEYPSARDFGFDKERPETIPDYETYGLDAEQNGSTGFQISPVTVYREGIYAGYRYFDSFGRAPLYPFGHGLSYADFAVTEPKVRKEGQKLVVTAMVRNTSENASGREVVQVYLSAPSVRLEQPYQRFAGCAKTALLSPGQRERVTIGIPLRELASYDEKSASWILEPGLYFVRVGNSSRNTHIAGALLAERLIVCERAENILSIRPENEGKIDFLSARNAVPVTYEGEEDEKRSAPAIPISEADFLPCPRAEDAQNPQPAVLEKLSSRELAAMAVGYGTGLPFGGMGSKAACTLTDDSGKPLTEMTHPSGALGYVSPALPQYGIPSARYADGPAGVGLTAWPVAMLSGCSFDEELLTLFGEACGYEAVLQRADSWLAPGLNLQRNPLGGRNFEYFSEDPCLTGICGISVCRGAARNLGLTACPKHLALNEQETYRRGNARLSVDAVDSIAQERTARELYLKPFEMVIKNSPVLTVMTSFNKINGVFAAQNHDLCTKLLRREWGYRGVVITDWGDMDVVADGADAVAAGNDVIMPGGPPVIRQILKGLAEERVTRGQLLEAVSHLLYFVTRSGSYAVWSETNHRQE